MRIGLLMLGDDVVEIEEKSSELGGYEVVETAGKFVILQTKWNAYMVIDGETGKWMTANQPSLVRAREVLPADVRATLPEPRPEPAKPKPFSVWRSGGEIDLRPQPDYEVGTVFAFSQEEAESKAKETHGDKVTVGKFC